jgi:eukaryotic-like serine/threonine-protein kinase
MIGHAISHYKVLEMLGEGGMGVVHKAMDTHLDRLVAFKVLPRERVADAERKERFVREAKAASSLNHPNIVTIYDIDSADGIDFIAMELVVGKTLDRCIPRHGLRPSEILRYAVQIADALATAHKAGIVHRDLKPSNVMINEQGLVKLLDFGLAKLTEPTATGEDEATRTLKPATEEGMIVGTVSYMSPEQAEGKKLDARSDIFSFGALLYEMTTGQRAFQGDSRLSTLTAILREEPKPAGQVVEDLPRELERIISRCLRKDPQRRFQAMPDLKVALEELKEESDSGKLTGVVTVPKRLYRWRMAWTIALLVLVGVVGSLWFARSARKAPEPTLTPVPLTTFPGFQGEPSFSPDGNQVAFGWDGNKQDNEDIYVKLIGTSGPPLRLTNDPLPDHGPAWSPDGRFIAFLRESREKSEVILIPALGGPERKIAEIKERSELPGPYLAWSPDGNSLVISDRDPLTGRFALFLLLIETGEKRKLTSPPPSLVGDTSPAFSPDGHTLAFSRRVDLDYGLGDLYVLNLLATSDGLKPAGQAERITFENRGARSPAWTSDGREIVFSDRIGVWRISRSASAQPRQITSFGNNVDLLAISRHGQRLTYEHTIFHTNIWRLIAPIVDGNQNRDHGLQSHRSAVSLISSTRNDSAPQYSGDGKKIAFMSNRSGNPEIWSCDNDGSNARQLTSFDGPQVTTPRWSPDSSRIAFDSDAEGEYDIWVISADGGRPQRMTTHPSNDGNPSWSHDGRWIYFDSARTGEQQVWKMPANGGEAIQVTRDRGFAPLESPDGKFVYYLKDLADTDVWRISTDGAQVTRVLEGLSDYRNLDVVESGLVFVPIRNTSSLQFLNFATGKIRVLANVDRPVALYPIGGLAVSPDGRSILYTQIEQAGSEMMLVENFR